MKTLRIIALILVSCSLLLVSCKKTKQYTITVTVNDSSMGSATGGGTYEENTTATLTATANSTFKFVKWNDGNTSNPRTVKVTENASFQAIFTFEGEEPDENGVYVTLGTESWKAAAFQVDAQSINGKIRIWLYKSTESDYPQFQGWMDVNTSGEVNASLVYLASENDIDNEGYPIWESTELTTNLVSINMGSHKITALQTGKMRNKNTSEEIDLRIAYKNASWEPAPTPSKFWQTTFR